MARFFIIFYTFLKTKSLLLYLCPPFFAQLYTITQTLVVTSDSQLHKLFKTKRNIHLLFEEELTVKKGRGTGKRNNFRILLCGLSCTWGSKRLSMLGSSKFPSISVATKISINKKNVT